MSRDEEKLIRQLSLLSYLLSEPRPFSAREIQESVEGYWSMSDETFARRFNGDRTDLEKIGIEVQASSASETGGTPVYYLPADEYRLPSIDFTAAERRALAIALTTLEGRFAYSRPLRMAFAAISQGLPEPLPDGADHVPIALAPDQDAIASGKQLARIEDAVGRLKTVCFVYLAADGDEEERCVDPYSLFLIQGHWYVIGYDHARADIRTFRVTRIKGSVRFATEKPKDFVVPEEYDPEQYGARPPWLLGKIKGSATFKIDEDLSWWVSRLQPHVRLINEDDQGCGHFSVPYADEEVLLAWAAGLDGCGELLGPADLRNRLAQGLVAVCEVHRQELSGYETSTMPPVSKRPMRPKRAPERPGPIATEHLARAIALMQYLLDERTPSSIPWTTLEEDLGLTKAEIEADLRLLNLVNFGGGTYAVLAEPDEQGVNVTPDMMADLFSRPARLSPLMTRALLLALDLLGEAISMDSTDTLASVREKVRRLAGTLPETTNVAIDDVVHLSADLLATLNRCIQERLLVELEYFTPTRGRIASRQVEPYLLFRGRDGWYLEAYCLRAQAQRTFRLEFVRSAQATEKTFVPRKEMDLSARTSGAPFPEGGSVNWAIVRFSPRWRQYLEDRGISYVTLTDGRLRGRMPYLDERWLAREIVRFLGEAVLESPPEARTRIDGLASSLLRTYRGGDTPDGRESA